MYASIWLQEKDGRKTIFISPTRKIIHTRVSNLHRSSFKAFLNKKWNDFRGVYHLLYTDMSHIIILVFPIQVNEHRIFRAGLRLK